MLSHFLSAVSIHVKHLGHAVHRRECTHDADFQVVGGSIEFVNLCHGAREERFTRVVSVHEHMYQAGGVGTVGLEFLASSEL